ncbi:hypothetical protein JCM8202_000784 [Rhodotorula sphaerocarpa]
MELPVLDIAPFLEPHSGPNNDQRRRETAAHLDRFLTHFGFLYLTGYGSVVTEEELATVLDVARSFFARPDEEKANLKIRRGDGARGWQKIGENVTGGHADWHEGWDCYKPVEHENPQQLLHGPNQWPAEPTAFRPTLEAHFSKMQVLGHALMEATAMALGLDAGDGDYAQLKEWTSDPFWVARCIGYPPLPPDATGVSCGAHRDYGNWTLLLADPTPGALQVFLRDPAGNDADPESNERGTWIDADPKPGHLVVNVGEMVEIYSAGLYKATLHRVVHRSPTYRVSVPFFFEPNYEAEMSPLAAACQRREQEDPSNAREAIETIKPITYGDFLAAKVAKNFALEES